MALLWRFILFDLCVFFLLFASSDDPEGQRRSAGSLDRWDGWAGHWSKGDGGEGPLLASAVDVFRDSVRSDVQYVLCPFTLLGTSSLVTRHRRRHLGLFRNQP
jgi:hypothetical protein